MEFDRFTLVLLVRPPDAPDLPADELDALQDRHLAHQARLAEQGHVLVAGPLAGQDDERLRGICVLTVDPATARRLYSTDPAVQAGRLAVEVATWLVPAGGAHFTATRLPASMAEALADS
jgi:uncharacterized protein YciI